MLISSFFLLLYSGYNLVWFIKYIVESFLYIYVYMVEDMGFFLEICIFIKNFYYLFMSVKLIMYYCMLLMGVKY